jgi:hypothetical protein
MSALYTVEWVKNPGKEKSKGYESFKKMRKKVSKLIDKGVLPEHIHIEKFTGESIPIEEVLIKEQLERLFDNQYPKDIEVVESNKSSEENPATNPQKEEKWIILKQRKKKPDQWKTITFDSKSEMYEVLRKMDKKERVFVGPVDGPWHLAEHFLKGSFNQNVEKGVVQA